MALSVMEMKIRIAQLELENKFLREEAKNNGKKKRPVSDEELRERCEAGESPYSIAISTGWSQNTMLKRARKLELIGPKQKGNQFGKGGA